MDDGKLSGRLDPADDPGNAAQIAVQHKNDLHILLQTGLKPAVVADSRDDGITLQRLIQSLIHVPSVLHRTEKRAQKPDGPFCPFVPCSITPGRYPFPIESVAYPAKEIKNIGMKFCICKI